MTMSCRLEEFTSICLMINSGALILIIISLICTVINRSIERSLRGILISYSAANTVGSCFFIYDMLTYSCGGDHKKLNFMYAVTVLMSFAHILLLILHYQNILSCSKKTKGRDFVGLIFTSWVTSSALGCIETSLDVHTSHLVVVVGFAVMAVVVLLAYVFVLRKQRTAKAIRLTYIKRFLYTDKEDDDFEQKIFEKIWSLKLLAVIIVSFIACCIPWQVFAVRGLHNSMRSLSIPLSVYSLSFYVPSFVCMFMKWNDNFVRFSPVV